MCGSRILRSSFQSTVEKGLCRSTADIITSSFLQSKGFRADSSSDMIGYNENFRQEFPRFIGQKSSECSVESMGGFSLEYEYVRATSHQGPTPRSGTYEKTFFTVFQKGSCSSDSTEETSPLKEWTSSNHWKTKIEARNLFLRKGGG